MKNERARAIILDKTGKKILLIFRRKDDRTYYVFPGGGVEDNETSIDTVIREIKEETSVNIKNMSYLKTINVLDTIQHFYIAEYDSGEIILGSPEKERNTYENYYEPQWIDICELGKIDLYPEEIKALIINQYK